MELCLTTQLSAAATLTATGFTAYTYDTLLTGGQPNNENVIDPIGAYIPFASVPFYGSANETYQWQIINDSATNGTTSPTVVADTGTMNGNDNRLLNPDIFLAIDWSLVNQRYLMLKLTVAGNNPSTAISGAWIVSKSAVPASITVPANYTWVAG